MSILLPKQRHVALVIEMSNEYSRGILSGIRDYMREHRPWTIDLREQSRDFLDYEWLKKWRGDGIIARIQSEEMGSFLQQSNMPIINLSSSVSVPGIPCVETDDQAIARRAADHLLERGFRHFAFCGHSGYSWSRLRAKFFGDYLASLGYTCHFFDSAASVQSGVDWLESMAEWLSALPRPIGVMAAYDILGRQVLEASRKMGKAVPDEVGVIGVDNEELLCELCFPPLSSVVPDSRRTGYLAASLLEKQMNGEQVEPDLHLIPPVDLITRLSTDRIAVDDPLVSEAVRFIRNHAYDAIKVEDVLKPFSVSRRVLENRFRKALGRSPHDEITAVRVDLLKRLLRETNLTTGEIAERTGFEHPEYMYVFFKRQVGLSPGEYRSKKL